MGENEKVFCEMKGCKAAATNGITVNGKKYNLCLKHFYEVVGRIIKSVTVEPKKNNDPA